METPDDETLFRQSSGLGIVTLNRPKALNALSPTQFGAIDARLAAWATDPTVTVVMIEGAGERAFSAGGDIKAVWDGRQKGDEAGNRELFRAEYRLDRRIHHYAKPYVAVLDGIVMGGGAGVSINGRFRVATERSLFAMPECAIGFFPDVGATHFLSRCPGRLGLFLGLTGTRLGPADMLAAGLATHFVPAAGLEGLRAGLEQASRQEDAGQAVADLLERLHRSPGPSALAGRLATIDQLCRADGPQAMMAALDAVGEDWADLAAAAMRAASPTSLAVTWRQLTEGQGLGFDDAIRREFRLACTLLQGSEFHEGIRALVIDKDKSPRWRPASLALVQSLEIDRLFAGVNDELTFP
ncbi:Enoyl-CoA hydratase/carnithine racemase [Magnetospirillum sp. LM-5]|uniref:enoyl-CoA hydratase/isomerase family protein n=1 Tax=Magnetospirillum sp. LM-5 TaxID=2681466 RepID=UPI001384D9C0|nr:enoyl-CoA hydratase/isomerase family protein [Magnetospirillum sp. LM-5]CAA7613273.1 Enoyl-CoA hydratase/carnithine racemase [Magnetospirillum sp. LM-5]